MPAPHPPHIVQTARRLRREGSSSVTIAAVLGIPARTVQDWLRGYGATTYIRACPVCRERFFTSRQQARYCSKLHYMKHYNALGPLRNRGL